jgi:hypothetical protein
MLFRVDGEGAVESVPTRELAELGLSERYDLQEWVLAEPRILGEQLLVITSEYAGFEDTLDRLDVLALDREGKLVVVELKRDRADANTDLQALKYASFCSTLTAEDVQQEYREFHNARDNEELSPEEVADRFAEFLETDGVVEVGESGWAQFELDDRPRVMLAAGEFGTEVTSPVLWLNQEYGLDISCVRLSAYEQDGEYLVQGQRIIPVPEAEEYMTKRREKQEKQRDGRSQRAIKVLLERGVLREGDELLFNKAMFDADWGPEGAEERWDPDDELWRAVVTGKEGRSNNVRWRYDGEEYSFTGLSNAMLDELGPVEWDTTEGYWYWTHPEFDYKSLSGLQDEQVTAHGRKSD